MRRRAEGVAEEAQEVVAGYARLAGQIVEGDGLGVAVMQVVSRAAEPAKHIIRHDPARHRHSSARGRREIKRGRSYGRPAVGSRGGAASGPETAPVEDVDSAAVRGRLVAVVGDDVDL